MGISCSKPYMQHSRSKRFISCVSWHASFVDTTNSAFKRGEDVAEYPLLDSLIGGFLRLHVMKINEKIMLREGSRWLFFAFCVEKSNLILTLSLLFMGWLESPPCSVSNSACFWNQRNPLLETTSALSTPRRALGPLVSRVSRMGHSYLCDRADASRVDG